MYSRTSEKAKTGLGRWLSQQNACKADTRAQSPSSILNTHIKQKTQNWVGRGGRVELGGAGGGAEYNQNTLWELFFELIKMRNELIS